MKHITHLRKVVSEKLWGLSLRQRWLVSVLALILLILLIIFSVRAIKNRNAISHLTITSTAFKDAQPLPTQYTCDGENSNPPIDISGVPSSAKSLVLVMEDATAKDHPVHWITWNIPATTLKIMEGIRPAGTVARSYAGNFGYSGPCPAQGEEHQYTVQVYALSKELLTLNSGATINDLNKAIQGNVVAEGQLHTSYKRVKTK